MTRVPVIPKIYFFLTLIQILLSASKSFATASNALSQDNAGPTGRIYGGTNATTENSMYMVSIHLRLAQSYFGKGLKCGGSLITPSVVLTAAHCFVNTQTNKFMPARFYHVAMGNLNRYKRDNNTLLSGIQRIAYSPRKFNPVTYEDDIAMAFLPRAVPPNHPTVRPIALNTRPMHTGTVCQATGWGLMERGIAPAFLRTVDLEIISEHDCKKNTNLEMVLPGMMCAGYMEGVKDTCSGDSGGPLVCGGLLTGITSWGTNCAQPKLPGVYTDVQMYASWIKDELKDVHKEGLKYVPEM